MPFEPFVDDSASGGFVPFDMDAQEPRSSPLRRARDVPVQVVKGVLDLPGAVVGLADTVSGGAAGRGVDHILNATGAAADAIGLPAWARPSRWSEQLKASYAPETRAATEAMIARATDAEAAAKAEGAGALGQIGAGAKGAAIGMIENPSSVLTLAAESYGGMKAIAMGTAKLLKTFAAGLDTAVAAGTPAAATAALGKTAAKYVDEAGVLTAEGAEKALSHAAIKYAAAGEGILTAGQVGQHISKEDPEADWARRLAALPAGLITGAISRGAAKIPGLGDAEASMATASLGKSTGFSGGLTARTGKGILSEGVLQEAPQGAQEEFWTNVGLDKPLHEGVGAAAVQGLAAGGALGGGVAATHGSSPKQKPTTPAPEILDAKTADEAIAAFKFDVSRASMPAAELEDLRRTYKNATSEELIDQQNQLLKALENDISLGADEQGNPTFNGAPLKVVAPQDLTGGEGSLSRDQYEALSVLASAQGKKLIVYADDERLPDGFVNAPDLPDKLFISSRTTVDAAAVAAHETQHLLDTDPAFAEFSRIVDEELTEQATTVAKKRHGDLPAPALLAELRADLVGDAWASPEFLGRVVDQMRARLDDKQAEKVATGFLEQIAQLIARVKAALTGSTFTTDEGARLATAYVKNLERVHSALAAAIADRFISEGRRPPGADTNAGMLLVQRALELQRQKAEVEQIAGFQRTAQQKIIAESPYPSAPEGASPSLTAALAAAQKPPFLRNAAERLTLEAVRIGAQLSPKTDRNRMAAATTRTPEFRKWFDKGSVVNTDGTPKVMYHGTDSDIRVFDKNRHERPLKAIFLTGSKPFANHAAQNLAEGEAENIMPVYTNVSNVFDYASAADRNTFRKWAIDTIGMPADKATDLTTDVSTGNWEVIEADPRVVRFLKEGGYDGAYIKELGVKNLAVFDPKKIKSAIGNSGAFDRNNPDISKSPKSDRAKLEASRAKKAEAKKAEATKIAADRAKRGERLAKEKAKIEATRVAKVVEKAIEKVVAAAAPAEPPAPTPVANPYAQPPSKQPETPKIDPDELTRGFLARMDFELREMGYDSRGAEDVRSMLRTRMLRDEKLWHEDWIKAYEGAQASVARMVARREEKALATGNAKNVDFKRIRELGYTEDWREAGYITPAGSLIDLSGKRDGGERGQRALDHREAGGTVGMQEYMALGNIRIDNNSGSLDISKAPSDRQLGRLAEFIENRAGEVTVDMEDGLGELRGDYYMRAPRAFSREYPAGTKPARVLADIKRFYSGQEPLALPHVRFSPKTPEFKKWFGNSKVVDRDGNPLVVYHGSGADITRFDTDRGADTTGNVTAVWGVFFTPSPGEASNYATMFHKEGQNVLPAYLSIQNPREMSRVEWDRHATVVYRGERTQEEALADERAFKAQLQAEGFDGVHITTIRGFNDEWVAFEPTQIKSATGNSGAFDAAIPDIQLSPKHAAMYTPPARAVRDNRAMPTNLIQQLPDGTVADRNGKPLLLYHGTDKQFDAFDLNADPVTYEEDRGKVFFTSDRAKAVGYSESYGLEAAKGTPRVVEAYVTLKNPYVIDNSDSPTEDWDASGRLYDSYAKEGGHDGIIISTEDRSEKMVVAFRADQIRTAVGGGAQMSPKTHSGRIELADGAVVGDVVAVENDFVSIHEWSSHQRGKTVGALQELRERFKAPITVHDVGTGESKSYWQEMKRRGLVDTLLDGEGVQLSPKNPFPKSVVQHVVYHGSAYPQGFERSGFSYAKKVVNDFGGDALLGFFFGGKQVANAFGAEGAVVPAYLDLRNPKKIDAATFRTNIEQKSSAWWAAAKRRMLREGYDGVVVPPDARIASEDGWVQFAEPQYIAFKPEQIKSAISGIQLSPKTPEFRKWFRNSKVVDARGEPLVVYHGTKSDFDTFDLSKAGSNNDTGMWGTGFYFSPIRKMSFGYGDKLKRVYLSLQNPLVLHAVGENWPDIVNGPYVAHKTHGEEGKKYSDSMRNKLIEAGYDGVMQYELHFTSRMIMPSEKLSQVVAFYPNQIKSVSAKQFDPADLNIQASPKQLTTPTPRPASKASWDAPEPSRIDDIIRTMQDKHIDLKRALEQIRKRTRVTDAKDAYLKEELYHGRSAKKVDDFLATELKPLLIDMAARGVSMEDLETYLHARHAEEANNHIAAINPDLPDGGSGMATADARRYLAQLTPQQSRAYAALATRVDAMNVKTRQSLVTSGLESQETIDGWGQMFDHYVPLHREDMGEGPGSGQGISVRGSFAKSRTGSERQVVDIIANMAMQRERAIVRGEKARVGVALYGLAQSNPNPDFWKVDSPPLIKTMGANGVLVSTVDPTYRSRDNVVMVRFPDAAGEVKDHAILFNERDERAMRMAAALKNLDMDELGQVLGISAKITRYIASVNTQYNPVFGVVNLVRDFQGAIVNLSSTELAGKQAQVMAHTLSALKGVHIDTRQMRAGQQATSPWSQLWEEFQDVGGKTGYRDMFRTSADRGEAIQRELKRATEGKAMQFGRSIFDWLSDYNTAMENAVRLSAYKVGLDSGMTKERAASLAKNLTVNFNRKGQAATQAGALYAFFNASVQGTARLVETLAGPAGRKIIAGGLILGTMQALALAAAGFDDEEPPEFIRERNLIIPIGDKKYLTIPMPLGLHVLPNISRQATEYALSGFRDPGRRVARLVGTVMGAFNPIGNAGMSLQSLAPTAVDPLVALAENRDWTGRPIARGDMNKLAPTPGHTRAKGTSSAFSKAVSEGANWLSGGTKYKPGFFSPTPDQIDYLIGQATGGVGREAMKIEQTITSSVTGEDLPAHKIPLAGRFYGDSAQTSSQANAFYSNLERLNAHEAEIKGRQKHGEPVGDYLKDNPDARLYQMANKIERDVSALRKQKRALVEKGANADRVKLMDLRIAARMSQLNEQVKAARQ